MLNRFERVGPHRAAMSGPDPVFLIDDAATFELLADPTRVEILESLMVPKSVTQVAEVMGVPRTRLYHHFKLLHEAGMIRVVETRRVGAATESIHQASAYSFKPSRRFLESAVPRTQAEAVLTSLLGATRADVLRAVDEGIASIENRGGDRRLTDIPATSPALTRAAPCADCGAGRSARTVRQQTR